MDLRNWNIRLERHFAQLRNKRSIIASEQPIYCLEHGLGKEELKSLSRSIKERILQGPPSNDHWLAWIVYATEFGYEYTGDEYWQTFEKETPGWAMHGDRYWLKTRFVFFHQKYGGAKPKGGWAEHFSIICWPITNAILPKDLQRQLARILFELRHSFSTQFFESPTTLGESIAARSWNATSRFQNFAQETQLVGQIAAALLLQGKFGTAGIIEEETLQRIGEDLDRERRAREWLRSARKMAERRAQRGLLFGYGRPSSAESQLEKARSEVQELGIEPRLILRPKNEERNLWEVLLEIPDLSHLIFKFPELSNILTSYRCVVAGSSGRPLARGRLLHGSQRIILSRWPDSDEVLLKFDRPDPKLEYLLSTECLLRPGPTWLFRIASDNLAYEVRSLRVRPGERYIIVNVNNAVISEKFTRSINLMCDGTYSAIIELPSSLNEEWEEWLNSHGLSRAKSIEVWPAGLGAVFWDGEGYGEWLASDQPCIAVRSDYPIDTLIAFMDSDPNQSLEIAPVSLGKCYFIELPELPVGLHKIKFLTRQATAEQNELLGELDVAMRIREAHPWSPGISPQGPLLVHINPVSPTLEQLWEEKTEITVEGPKGRQVECKISLFESYTGPATLIKSLPPIDLPVSQDTWRDYFEKYFKKLKKVEITYDAARACELYFNAEELGAFRILCEREFTPLRWTVQRDKKGYIAKIFDDSGNCDPPVISYYTFERPSIEERLDHDFLYQVPSVGGLYVARQGNLNAAIIIPPEITIKGFSELRFLPHFDTPNRSPEAVMHFISIAALWSNARLVRDPISSLRQHDVLLTITRQVFFILGGRKWYESETLFQDKKLGLLNLKESISNKGNEKEFATILSKNCATLAKANCKQRVERFASLAVEYFHLQSVPPKKTVISKRIIRKRPVRSAENPSWLCELALRLACDISTTEVWGGDGLRNGMVRLLNEPTLARSARFLVIAIDQQLGSRVIPGKIYSGWEWA